MDEYRTIPTILVNCRYRRYRAIPTIPRYRTIPTIPGIGECVHPGGILPFGVTLVIAGTRGQLSTQGNILKSCKTMLTQGVSVTFTRLLGVLVHSEKLAGLFLHLNFTHYQWPSVLRLCNLCRLRQLCWLQVKLQERC